MTKNSFEPLSEGVSTFLNWLRECKFDQTCGHEDLRYYNMATQDIMHYLEFAHPNRDAKAKLASRLTEIRRERRKIKDNMDVLRVLMDWVKENQDIIHSLEELLGNMRKVEDGKELRLYYPRTHELDDLPKIPEIFDFDSNFSGRGSDEDDGSDDPDEFAKHDSRLQNPL